MTRALLCHSVSTTTLALNVRDPQSEFVTRDEMNPPSKKMNHPFLSILSITKAHARGPPLQATVALLFGTIMHAFAGHSDDGYKGFTLWVNISLLFLIDSNIGSMISERVI